MIKEEASDRALSFPQTASFSQLPTLSRDVKEFSFEILLAKFFPQKPYALATSLPMLF
jgi:hypothetical protein